MESSRIVCPEDLDETSSTPLYQQLHNVILKRIKDGDLKIGDAIPSEKSLSENLGLARGTVRRALLELVESGHAVRRPGKGSFVTKPPVKRSLDNLLDFSTEIKAQGLEPGSRTLRFEVRVPSRNVAQHLGLNAGENVYEIDRIRLADGLPRALERIKIPTKLCPDLTEKDLEGAIYPRIVSASGSAPEIADEIYEAVMVSPRDAQLLEIDEQSPAFRITRITKNGRGEGFEYSTMLVPGERSRYHITLRSDGNISREHQDTQV